MQPDSESKGWKLLTPKKQVEALLESFRGAISLLVDNYTGKASLDKLFEAPCPKELSEVWDFARNVVDVIEKAAKAKKQNKSKAIEVYRTALLEGCLKDGQITVKWKRTESDVDLIARVAVGLIRGQVNLEEDQWFRVLWHLPR